MFYTTSGEIRKTPISREDVLTQVMCALITKDRDKVSEDYEKAVMEIYHLIEELPVMQMPDGKRLVKRYYPRIKVKPNFYDAKPFRVGDNSHDELQVLHGKNASFITYLNWQSYCGTEFEDEGYSFVGEKYPEEYGEHYEYIPFDEVWVEEKEHFNWKPSNLAEFIDSSESGDWWESKEEKEKEKKNDHCSM